MIMSLLTDPTLMNDQFFPEGYNVFTGQIENHSANDKYGKVHTGDAWIPARDRYCKNKTDMPVTLIVFADKSHTDLHGALSLTPIIFMLSLFNCTARNITSSEGQWDTYRLSFMGRALLIKLKQKTKYKMSTNVFPSFLNHLKRNQMEKGLTVLC